jgi:hypothetical protein
MAYHSLFLDFDPEQGIPSGQSWERTLYRKLRACHAVVAILSADYLESYWCFAEIALARMERKPIFALKTKRLTSGAKLPSILEEGQYLDVRSDDEEAYVPLWRGFAQAHITQDVVRRWNGKDAPYPGLHYFREAEEALFFGREIETKQGLDLLNSGRTSGLLMILGVSGSGKSSLVRAGMVPQIRREPERWGVVGPFRPGPMPTHRSSPRDSQAHSKPIPGRLRRPWFVRASRPPSATSATKPHGWMHRFSS